MWARSEFLPAPEQTRELDHRSLAAAHGRKNAPFRPAKKRLGHKVPALTTRFVEYARMQNSHLRVREARPVSFRVNTPVSLTYRIRQRPTHLTRSTSRFHRMPRIVQ